MSHRRALGLLSILAVPVFFFELGNYGMVTGDEAYYHYAARHMLASGDWSKVVLNGEVRWYDTFTHAPLFFWLKALVLWVLGDSYWSMRILSAGFALLSVVATYGLACAVSDRRVGLLAALVQLTTYQFVYMHCGRTGEMEPLILCTLTTSLLLFMRSVETGRGFLLHHLCLVLLVNLKAGLVVVPILAEMLHFACNREARKHAVSWIASAAWMLPLGCAWHLYQIATSWDEFERTRSELIEQVSEGKQDLGALGNAWFYAKVLAWGGFPHSLLYPVAAVVCFVPRADRKATARWHALALYCAAIVAFVCPVALHYPWYVAPLYPFLSIAVAAWLVELGRRKPGRLALSATLASLLLGTLVRFDFFTFDPFEGAATMRDSVRLAGVGPLPPAAAASALVVVALALGFALHRSWSDAWAPWTRRTAALLSALLVGIGALRVGAALRFTDHVSPVEELSREVHRARAHGEDVELPLELPQGSDIYTARYFFGDFYELRRRRVVRDGEPTVVISLVGNKAE